jgi:hypothetical protein
MLQCRIKRQMHPSQVLLVTLPEDMYGISLSVKLALSIGGL